MNDLRTFVPSFSVIQTETLSCIKIFHFLPSPKKRIYRYQYLFRYIWHSSTFVFIRCLQEGDPIMYQINFDISIFTQETLPCTFIKFSFVFSLWKDLSLSKCTQIYCHPEGNSVMNHLLFGFFCPPQKILSVIIALSCKEVLCCVSI